MPLSFAPRILNYPPIAQPSQNNYHGNIYNNNSSLSEQTPELNQNSIPYSSHNKNMPTYLNTDKNYTKNRVAIILGYYNGNQYLSEQIRSILNQSHQNFKIFISDDCSPNKVDFDRLNLRPNEAEKIHLKIKSSNVGFARNFLESLRDIDPQSFQYFAFSDQDDIWHRNKLKNALITLTQYPDDIPALYCARTTITDASCQYNLYSSPLFKKPPSFKNALVQNIGGGNTMVFNKSAQNIIIKSITDTKIFFHDWWCYQIISGAGGAICYDAVPCLKYRQHIENLIGSNNSWYAKFLRIQGLFTGNMKQWNDINIKALCNNKILLTDENKKCLDDLIHARQSSLFKRLLLFKRTGIYRQTFLGNLGLLLGLIMNKV